MKDIIWHVDTHNRLNDGWKQTTFPSAIVIKALSNIATHSGAHV